MHSTELSFFLAVARATSICAAAQTLNTVQSNVTARIKKLEDELGVPLFQRHARGVELTAAGKRLLPFAIQISQLLGEARQCVTEPDAPTGSLMLGAMETTTALRLGGVLTRFSGLYPDVDLSLRTGTSAELIEAVLNQQLEGAFVCGPVAHPRLTTKIAFTEELAVVAPPDMESLNSIRDRGHVRIFVLRRGCSYRQRLEELLAHRGIAVVRVMEYGTIDAILASVSAGMGITLLPAALLPSYKLKHRFATIRLQKREALVDTLFIRSARSYTSRSMTAFLDILEEPDNSRTEAYAPSAGRKAPHKIVKRAPRAAEPGMSTR